MDCVYKSNPFVTSAQQRVDEAKDVQKQVSAGKVDPKLDHYSWLGEVCDAGEAVASAELALKREQKKADRAAASRLRAVDTKPATTEPRQLTFSSLSHGSALATPKTAVMSVFGKKL